MSLPAFCESTAAPSMLTMRSGVDFHDHLARVTACIWYGDRYYTSPLDIAAMCPQIASVARYYDAHFGDPRMTFRDVEGESSIVHLVPTTIDDLWRKAEGLLRLASAYDGILGRAPDYMGVGLAPARGALSFFGDDFQDHVGALLAAVRHQDLYVTHTTTNVTDKDGHAVGIRVVRETSDGLEVDGVRAMATAAPLSDLIVMLPNGLADGAPPEAATVFAIPTSARGVTLVTRQRLTGVSPLSSRYEETDALILLDRVLIPWSHVLVYRDKARYQAMTRATGMYRHSLMQTAARSVAKLRTLVRLAHRAQDVFGLAKRDAFKSFCGRVLRDISVTEATYHQAIERAAVNAYGVWIPDGRLLDALKLSFAQAYPQLMEELRRVLGPELFHLFDDAALPAPLAEALGRAWGFPADGVRRRLALTAELFDLAASSFGLRQEMYEMHKAGTADSIARSFWSEFQQSEA